MYLFWMNLGIFRSESLDSFGKPSSFNSYRNSKVPLMVSISGHGNPKWPLKSEEEEEVEEEDMTEDGEEEEKEEGEEWPNVPVEVLRRCDGHLSLYMSRRA
jgi:hypothetical protein